MEGQRLGAFAVRGGEPGQFGRVGEHGQAHRVGYRSGPGTRRGHVDRPEGGDGVADDGRVVAQQSDPARTDGEVGGEGAGPAGAGAQACSEADERQVVVRGSDHGTFPLFAG